MIPLARPLTAGKLLQPNIIKRLVLQQPPNRCRGVLLSPPNYQTVRKRHTKLGMQPDTVRSDDSNETLAKM